MNILYGILCLVVGLGTLYILLKDSSILNSLRELETDRGVSYYAGIAAAALFVIMGIALIIRFFIID